MESTTFCLFFPEKSFQKPIISSSKAYLLLIKNLLFANQKIGFCPKTADYPHFVKRFLCFSAAQNFQIAKCRCRINLPTIAFAFPKDFIVICLYSPIGNNGMKMKSQGL